jgi:hypothetical protein
MKAWSYLVAIWVGIRAFLQAKNSMSSTPSLPSIPSPVAKDPTSLNLGVTTDVGAVANAVGEVAKLGTEVITKEQQNDTLENQKPIVDNVTDQRIEAIEQQVQSDVAASLADPTNKAKLEQVQKDNA